MAKLMTTLWIILSGHGLMAILASVSGMSTHLIDGPRTNNNLEGWHSRVKTLAGKAHLNIFEMVELFKTEQSHMEASQLAAGGTLRSKGPNRKRKEE